MSEISVTVVRNILEAQDRIAKSNRKLFEDHKVFVLNLMSSPGAGKTSLLERTIEAMKSSYRIAVIEGDIQSQEDALRIKRLGVETIQINTGGACHLDANMIQSALEKIPLNAYDFLIIENVGNLVCPAEFDLGEHEKAMILSVTEGDDKPLKYPLMFQKSSVLLINKIDLIPYVTFNTERVKKTVSELNPRIQVLEISCKTGEGIDKWVEWLRNRISLCKH
ncbi:MAG: hydrogenase nickel incorporation protein HypB [Syntrophobacterales bacterium]|nr:hydrogenase nickel incorporation protein HypB [Syntrophobacterales bacterium]